MCNENKEVCSACGRAGISCCERGTCVCAPSDFNNDIEEMKRALESSKYSIFLQGFTPDCLSGYSQKTLDFSFIEKSADKVFGIMPRTTDRPVLDLWFGIGKEPSSHCVFWTREKGCELPYEKRPRSGREMRPIKQCGKKGFEKESKRYIEYTRKWIVEEWKPYHQFLVDMAISYYDKNWCLNQIFKLVL